jgi:hypothetical protein
MRRKSIHVSQNSEHSEQVGFVMWFRLKFPDVLIFAIPNGSQRSKVTGKHLKDEGVVPGIPDLYIPAWKVWVEMKREYGGTLSDVQEGVIHYLKSIGDTVIVGYGATDASKKILELRKL